MMDPKVYKIAFVAFLTIVGGHCAAAQDRGFDFADPYRPYADPGRGGASAYPPFHDPYASPRAFRGAPDAYHVAPYRSGTFPSPPFYEEPGYGDERGAGRRVSVDPYAGGDPYVGGNVDGGGDPYVGGGDPYAGSRRNGGRYDLGENANTRTRAEVANTTGQPAGTIVIDTSTRQLYLTEQNGRALRYGIGVGREGFAWHGTAAVQRKAEWPGWTPPAEMVKRRPDLPSHMEGGIENPLGARAMYLYRGKRDTMFRIHGTNEPDTIGQAVSSGCIRMMNADVIDLYRRVPLGTRVVVL